LTFLFLLLLSLAASEATASSTVLLTESQNH